MAIVEYSESETLPPIRPEWVPKGCAGAVLQRRRSPPWVEDQIHHSRREPQAFQPWVLLDLDRSWWIRFERDERLMEYHVSQASLARYQGFDPDAWNRATKPDPKDVRRVKKAFSEEGDKNSHSGSGA